MGGQEPIGGNLPSKKELVVNNENVKKSRKPRRGRRKGEINENVGESSKIVNRSAKKSPETDATSETDPNYSASSSLSSSSPVSSASSSFFSPQNLVLNHEIPIQKSQWAFQGYPVNWTRRPVSVGWVSLQHWEVQGGKFSGSSLLRSDDSPTGLKLSDPCGRKGSNEPVPGPLSKGRHKKQQQRTGGSGVVGPCRGQSSKELRPGPLSKGRPGMFSDSGADDPCGGGGLGEPRLDPFQQGSARILCDFGHITENRNPPVECLGQKFCCLW